ncbi:unnamed protein product [Leptidea sinapis]|uniref:Helicase C-terminal domain-containing protein n=1 Tax=Leptidea sinapis TaxID=189913 RepID=A0A5E4Q6B7_9NEOP|nr:unnamed protein product [Leptidea sinapis]
MYDAGGTMSFGDKRGNQREEEDTSGEDAVESDDEDETIARIQRAHFAQAAAMNPRRRPVPRPRRMSHKRKLEAVRNFHDFTKKLKQDTGIKIRSLVGNDLIEYSDFSSEDNNSDSDGLSEEEFTVDPNAVQDLNEENESYIDPETGDIVESKVKKSIEKKVEEATCVSDSTEEPKTLSISDIINEGDLDLTKNVEITGVEESDLCLEKTAEDLLDMKDDSSQSFDITDKLKDMGEISVKQSNKSEGEESTPNEETKSENDDEMKSVNSSALNVRRNIREVMDEKNLDASTLAAQRQESERLARVQEQQRIIREVQRQIAINRQNKIHQKTISLLQGGSSILKKSGLGQKLNLPNTVLVKLPSGELKRTTVKQGQLEVTKVPKPTTSASAMAHKIGKGDQKTEKKEVVEIVDSLHVNDTYNVPDEQGRVLINIGHPENEEDIFLAPQIARVIKPHQIGGVRFLFDNIIESVERFSTSTGFGCILAHSMGLGKTLQIVAEFNMWLPLDASTSPLSAHGEVRPRNFPIYVLNDSHKTLQMRAKVVKDWTTTGGVLMIGYELYRLLCMKKDKKPRKKKKADAKLDVEKDKEEKKSDRPEVGNEDTQGSDVTKASDDTRIDKDDGENKMDDLKDDKKEDTPTDEEKKLLDEMYEALVKPGPDLVICDEGHRIKNSHSNISYALKQMRTKRRIVLTGYPLQNNLLEYWCMVDFVRPNYLGSKTEFCNMFERPIQNGQCIDSTPQDIRLMRYRAHVLHSLLVGFVQRRSHAVLQSTLPQKEEYVLLVRMTPLQRQLYDRFMNEVVRSASIWNHPDVLYNFLKKRSEVNAAIEEDLDLEEIGGVTKAGRAKNNKSQGKRTYKPRGSEYGNNFYPQQQYENNYPNQYPPTNNSEQYNQNYWGNNSYYNNSGYYNSTQFPNNSNPNFNASTAGYNNPQQYPSNFNGPPNSQYAGGSAPQNYAAQNRSRYPTEYPNSQMYGEYNSTNIVATAQYPNNQSLQNYSGPYPPQHYQANNPYDPSTSYNQYGNQSTNYPNYPPSQQNISNAIQSNPPAIKMENNLEPNYGVRDIKAESNTSQSSDQPPFGNHYNYGEPNASLYPEQSGNNDFDQYQNYPSLETKPPLCSAGSGSPVTSWPMTVTLKTEVDRLKAEDKIEMKSESDGEVKIEDLDTKTIVKDELKKEINDPTMTSLTPNVPKQVNITDKTLNTDKTKSGGSESEIETPKKGRRKGKRKESPKSDKSKPRARAKPKGRKDRKKSKEKGNEESDSEQSEKEEKLNKEEELAIVKKNEEMTYDWATDLLKDYIPGIIENSAKMDLFFYLLNESIKLGDRILLFSQSLFTLNLIEDFLGRNYIPGTNRVWERNTSYFRLDGSTHALEREKLINEFNANPNVYLFLVSTRAGSLGINLVGANRVIVFDASWNPCHDTQAVCRVYRYGQKKPCFVYRFVMDCCLEKKIYDRQINKQGMADRVVDECNPDAESEPKDLSEHKDKYIDVLMQGIIVLHGKMLSKEPFQHESLLVDRKEKKLSSAEKRLAQRGYELEKKAALAPKPTTAYRTVRTADGSLVQRPVASVRPMQHGARWIPADVWRRQGMTAQEMTLPLDVVIPTNSAEKTNIVLKAGQRVMVLKSPKGIYMQLESGKIIAIKTALKGLGQKGDGNTPIGKKGNRPSSANIPGSLKNNSAITITSKGGQRYMRGMGRQVMGQKITRPMLPGQKIAEIRNRLGEMRSYGGIRTKLPTPQMRMLRPNLPGSLSITRISKDSDKAKSNAIKSRAFNAETEVLDSDDDDRSTQNTETKTIENKVKESEDTEIVENDNHSENTVNASTEKQTSDNHEKENHDRVPIVLTTDEKLPSEEVLERKPSERVEPSVADVKRDDVPVNLAGRGSSKINLLKNYRHQRPMSRPQGESSLSQLERTASVLNTDGVPDFRKNLDDITQSYSPSEEKSSGTRKKRSPQKLNVESQERPLNMSHSVSNLLGESSQKPRSEMPQGISSLHNQRPTQSLVSGLPQEVPGYLNKSPVTPINITHSGLMTGGTTTSNSEIANDSLQPKVPPGALPTQSYPSGSTPPEGPYGQYPGYGIGYGGYPNPPYYGGYGPGYYPPYGTPPGFSPPPHTPPTDPYLPPNPQW